MKKAWACWLMLSLGGLGAQPVTEHMLTASDIMPTPCNDFYIAEVYQTHHRVLVRGQIDPWNTFQACIQVLEPASYTIELTAPAIAVHYVGTDPLAFPAIYPPEHRLIYIDRKLIPPDAFLNIQDYDLGFGSYWNDTVPLGWVWM